MRQSTIAFGLLVAVARSGGAQPPPPEPAEPTPPLPEAPPAEKDQAKKYETTPPQALEGEPSKPGTLMEVYGFVMTDAGFDFGKIGNPDWQDVLRPTKLPAFENEFGRGPRTFLGVRQTRFGVKTTTPTECYGDFKTTFEFELFGVGVDEGQTTFRLRHAYGDWKSLRAGQTWSPFMDIDVFPNTIEYWGPPGMAFFRNVQVAWMPIQGDSRVTVALERPGATADTSSVEGRVELEDVIPRFPAPDLSAEARYGGEWGYVELAGILRWIKWDDINPAAPQLGGDAFGWGLNLSTNLKFGPATLKAALVGGQAIENYMNDGSADIGVVRKNVVDRPFDGESLGVVGGTFFLDVTWNKFFTSSAGYSFIWIDNSSGQAADAFHLGQYALANLLFHPGEDLMFGAEFQYGRRSNNADDFEANDFRIQFSFRFSYGKKFGQVRK
ncbi:MAG: hypothetical protein KIT31_12055 [Deltaproteobacteria bacterium]|nr:hypothetical protein [Deltaproteobacteria bacterium]